MSKLPIIPAKKVERILLRLGYILEGGSGAHRTYRHPDKSGKVTVSHHGKKDIAPKTLKRILEQAGLTVEEFTRLL